MQRKDDSAPATSKTFASIDKSSFAVVFRSVLKSLATIARDTHVRFNEGEWLNWLKDWPFFRVSF